MKIIGWRRKGNVVRFALGKDDLKDWGGDDWDDAPYEHNACTELLFGVDRYADVVFGFDVNVLEAASDYHYNFNTPFCMNDFKGRSVPILIIDKSGKNHYYSECLDKPELLHIFMGDKLENIPWDEHGAVSLTMCTGD